MMSDNIDSLLTQLQNEVENSKRLGRMRLVDPSIVHDMLESVRAALPTTVERAKEIVATRSEILDKARKDAAAIVADAQQRAADSEAHANARVQDVVQHAKEKVLQMRAQGEQIVADAQAEAARLVSEHNITTMSREQAESMLRQARDAAESMESDSRLRAEQVIADAQNYSEELLRRTDEWGMQYTGNVRSVVEEIVNEAEETLAASLTDVRNTQKRLQATLTRTSSAPEFRAPEEPSLR